MDVLMIMEMDIATDISMDIIMDMDIIMAMNILIMKDVLIQFNLRKTKITLGNK